MASEKKARLRPDRSQDQGAGLPLRCPHPSVPATQEIRYQRQSPGPELALGDSALNKAPG